MAQLTSALAGYFRSTGNEWQTARQISVGMNLDMSRVRSALANQYAAGHLKRSGEPRRYRFKPDALRPNLSKGVTTDTFAPVAAEFCRRWDVTVPFEATRDNPEALTEWTEMLAR